MQVDSENSKATPRHEPSFINSPIPSSPYYYDFHVNSEEEVSLLDYWRVIRKRKFKIVLFALIVALITFFISLKMPKKYEAEVSITPVASSSGGGISSLMSQANSIPFIGGQLGSLSGESQKTMQFMTILGSRTLTEGVIQDLNLMPILFKDQWDELKKNWKFDDASKIPHLEDAAALMMTKIIKIVEAKKTGLIKVTVRLSDPHLATVIANHYIVRLQDFITHNSLTVAKRNRLFVEAQLQKNKIDYLEFSKKLSEFYTANQISSVQSKLDVEVGKLETVPKTFEEFREKLNDLEQQKDKSKIQLTDAERTGLVRNVPAQVYLQYLTLQRELLGRTNALLLQQYEMAKIEEAKEDLAFQMIDKAITPRSPVFPNIRKNVVVAFFGGLIFSIFIAFFLEYIEKLKAKEKSVLK